LARPAALERLDTPEPSPGFVVRLIKSSGTTGVPKVMATTHAVLSGIVHSNLLDFPPRIARRVNFLCLYNFTVRAVHWRAWLALRTGGTICFTGGDVLLPAIRSGVGNFVSFMPGDLARFVQSIPGDSDTGGRRPFDLRIDVSGGAVSNEVRRAARRMLTNDLNIIYAANEIQRISRVDDDEVGTLFPEVSVEIVDDRGNALPLGHYGTIRARSDLMVKAYIDAPELTRAAFIDGWYHSNDIGFQPSAGKLIVLGRADDMLNAGGVKIAPRPIEERLMTITGVRDALVTTIGEGETSVLLAAAETGGDGDVMEQRAAMERIASGYATDFRILVVAEFPRTETGKVLREDVRRLWRQSAIAGMI
jgi:acyl-CoA synthetase (AMP-forming)/AMP-acid ligase II